MNRLEAIKTIIRQLHGDEFMVHANGAISRESHHCADRDKNLYLVGSMGLPAAVSLGFALGQPKRKVVVMDGDGNLLMGFGNLALVGALKPGNLIHIILDNGVYGTTGNQATLSPHLELEKIAASCGYRYVFSAGNPEALEDAVKSALDSAGPVFIRVMLSNETPPKVARIPYSCVENKKRFRHARN